MMQVVQDIGGVKLPAFLGSMLAEAEAAVEHTGGNGNVAHPIEFAASAGRPCGASSSACRSAATHTESPWVL